ncbi:MAG: endonuclease/exonuclease/phosphatase family protein, partial [Bdellovibrionota bacterium]|nr:endonuclease/exonuclease/phosphatase family protein [Bdellovibrionota bacterium]
MILNQKKVFDLFRTLLFSFRLGRSLLHCVTSIFSLLFLTPLDLYSKDFANLAPAPIKDIKIAAFNTKTFGSKKIKNEKVFDYFVRLIKRYDVIFLQEIRNKNLSAVHKLYAALNKRSKEYDYRITRPLGRSSYKEQYAYFYKKRVFEEVNISETVIYPDEYDDFEREPFLIYLKLRKRNIDFFLVGVHVKPSDVVREVRRIKDVYHFGESYFNDSDAVILGDLNAD